MDEMPSRAVIFNELVTLLIKFGVKKIEIREDTSLYQDLGVVGDDAGELLDKIHHRFATRFDGFIFTEYFPNDDEYYWNPPRWFGFKNLPRNHLTVGHLADVIRQGAWFEPIGS